MSNTLLKHALKPEILKCGSDPKLVCSAIHTKPGISHRLARKLAPVSASARRSLRENECFDLTEEQNFSVLCRLFLVCNVVLLQLLIFSFFRCGLFAIRVQDGSPMA